MAKLLYPELSYEIVGVLFEVYNELGPGYQEKYYQRAINRLLKEKDIAFKEQVLVELIFRGKSIGRYFIDFIIENKIILEIKATPKFYQRDIKQVLGYLKQKNLELGILASFTKKGVLVERIIRGFN